MTSSSGTGSAATNRTTPGSSSSSRRPPATARACSSPSPSRPTRNEPDTAAFGRRQRDVRRGFSLPPAIGSRTIIDGDVHPFRTLSFLRSEPNRFASVVGRDVGDGASPITPSDYINTQFDASLSWVDIEWLRTVWDGPIVAKSIQRVDDAVHAAHLGVEAVALSNHGGRQLDGAPAIFDLVAPVAEAVADRAEISCDGGNRRGSDIVKVAAAGATAAMAGRAFLYALSAAGERGVDRLLEWFAATRCAR